MDCAIRSAAVIAAIWDAPAAAACLAWRSLIAAGCRYLMVQSASQTPVAEGRRVA
jgi:hypothetical protein